MSFGELLGLLTKASYTVQWYFFVGVKFSCRKHNTWGGGFALKHQENKCLSDGVSGERKLNLSPASRVRGSHEARDTWDWDPSVQSQLS